MIFNLIVYCFLFMHQYHISKIDINADAKTASYQVTVHMFIDDLELALKHEGLEGLKIGTSKEDDSAEDYISEYIQSHLSISVDGKPIELSFLGKEQSEDLQGIYCYLEGPLPSTAKKVKVISSILVNEFSDQKNIVTLLKSNKMYDQFILDRSKRNSD